MVRASVHAGDPAELCDTGHVSSLRGHRLHIGEVQDPGGKTVTFSCTPCLIQKIRAEQEDDSSIKHSVL